LSTPQAPRAKTYYPASAKSFSTGIEPNMA